MERPGAAKRSGGRDLLCLLADPCYLDMERMGQFVPVAKYSECRDGEGRIVAVGNEEIALFRVQDQMCALANACPHHGGPIGDGALDGKIVTCPWHGWEFNVLTGKNPVNPNIGVKTYPVRVTGDDVEVEL